MVFIQEWFTVNEAAEYLRISKRTIYKLTKEGRLPAYRIGQQRHRRFRKEDLDKVPGRILYETPEESMISMDAKSDPVLAEVWDNDQDAEYDAL